VQAGSFLFVAAGQVHRFEDFSQDFAVWVAFYGPKGETGMPDPSQSANAVSIVPYDARYKNEFRRLNEAWISEYFEMEETDHKVLDHPEDYILDSGGEILFAVERGTVAGTCALIKMADGPFDFELAKMAVDPMFRGRGIGQQLGAAIIDRARIRGAKTIFLESNTILAPAISLYRKLGFVETERQPTPYARGNIHMVLALDL
jgi:GNAT superfamily N-acetyltransferase